MLGGIANAEPYRVTDDRGVTVEFAQPPQRIVSMLPSLTETVCALGACDRLVAVDNYSNFPAQVQKLPHVGGIEEANIELIYSLKPDVVLIASSSRVIARMENMGFKVLALEPKTMKDVERVIDKTALIVGSSEGARMWSRINAGVDAAAATIPAAKRGTTVYFEVNSAPYAAGEISFLGEILSRLGMKNIVPASLGPFPKLNPEYVVRADPQLIMVGDRNAVALINRPGWGNMRALKNKQICQFNAAEGDTLVRPGPRMADAAQILASCIRGERFAK